MTIKVLTVDNFQRENRKPGQDYHVVLKGDTLSSIAANRKTTVKAIIAANPERFNPEYIVQKPGGGWRTDDGSSPHLIRPGEVILLPKGAAKGQEKPKVKEETKADRESKKAAQDTVDSVTKPKAKVTKAPDPQTQKGMQAARRNTDSQTADIKNLKAQVKKLEEGNDNWMSRAGMETMDFLGRTSSMPLVRMKLPFIKKIPVLGQLVSMISAFIRFCRMVYAWITKDENFDWKKEGIRMAADLCGAFVPGWGGWVSAIVNTGMNLWFEDDKSMDIMGWKVEKKSGLKTAYDKTASFIGKGADRVGGLFGGDSKKTDAKATTKTGSKTDTTIAHEPLQGKEVKA